MPNIDAIAHAARNVLTSHEQLEYGFDAETRPRPLFIPDPMTRGISFVLHRATSDSYRVLVTDRRVMVITRSEFPKLVASTPRPVELSVRSVNGRLAISGVWREGDLWVHGQHARSQARAAAGGGELPPWHALPPLALAGFWPRAHAFTRNFLPLLLLFVVGAVVGGLLKSTSAAIHASIVTLTTSAAIGLGLVVIWRDATGQSPGKRHVGIRVVDRVTCKPIGPARGAARLVGRALDVLSYGVGFLISLRTVRRQTFADLFAGSVVVIDPADPADPAADPT